MESALLPNSGVTEEYFMEAYALAIQRNDGESPKIQLRDGIQDRIIMAGQSKMLITDYSAGNPLPPQTTKTLQQGSACILYALLDPSLRGKRESTPSEAV